MGTWHLEVGKMVLYIAFPVSLFHWFNQPENFAKQVEDVQQKLREREPPGAREQMRSFIEDINRKHDFEQLQAMEAQYENRTK